jgi:hypothetical protein
MPPRRVLIEAGKACAIERLVTFRHGLGELLGIAEQFAGAAARGVETLASFAFGFQRADLDDPAGARSRFDRAVMLDGLSRLWSRRCQRGLLDRLLRDCRGLKGSGLRAEGRGRRAAEGSA